MSLKATIFFSVWTSLFCSIFNAIYMMLPVMGGHPWIMFICLAVFFGMNSQPKDAIPQALSATCGVFWGQFDLFLMTFGVFGSAGFGFLPILVGTTITMILHIYFFGKLPIGVMPFIFAAVALTFATGTGLMDWAGMLGLWLSILFGLCLCAICAYGMQIGLTKWPAQEA